MRCPECNSTVNDNICLKCGPITVGGVAKADNEKIQKQGQIIEQQKKEIEDLKNAAKKD